MARRQRKKEDIIRESHERSSKYGIKPEQRFSQRILSGEAKEIILRDNQDLIEVAGPFLDLLYDFLKESGFILLLTSKDGCILRITGDETTLKAANDLNMVVGAFLDEKNVGTNAMGTAISEDMPIQVSATEHFITAYQKWTCSAAPIHDENGNIVGTINLTGSYELAHPHTLSLVVAAVVAIENQLQNRLNEQRLKESVRFVNQVMDSMLFAVISMSERGIIRSSNKMAYKLLKIQNEDLPGKHISEVLPEWNKLFDAVKDNRVILDEEQSLITSRGKEPFSINVYPITLNDGYIDGMVVGFREMKRVYRIVNKYTGMNARYTFEDLIGESDEMKRVTEYARAVANSPSTILITGESGTGKEVVAQAVHNASNRMDNGFVALNCGAISPGLIESELFGYEEGSFTGAGKGGRPGKFELAHGGTLFLDEIGEMPLDMQVKLLRALQESAITRVGGNKLIPVDVRIVAATNKNLKEEIAKGNFRSDLFYRLSVIPIHIPALRERREDIPILIQYFLNLKAIKLDKMVPEISKPLYTELVQYEWPGNIRELENFIEKFVNLDGDLSFETEPHSGSPLPLTEAVNASNNTVRSLAATEKDAIREALNAFSDNISQTAKALGISRNALYEKIKRHGI
ncbi:MAG: sigma 54-interacting transcriptional regulator [Lentimicrobiaceae bacterium]|jgi:transcriptional regulator with PAS, ATPase and Fis domain|nr:sigma 54-interacting transcriptional regulator [Lentimicrobiaceae bacterium]MDD4597448.1 sigma 54-interacting transcriptional regulator [Lentimicrobiaceae bacterium]HAH58078.1 sigma-54-dependent Fis family transcriptional regulator [Bacteroidales bacterium]